MKFSRIDIWPIREMAGTSIILCLALSLAVGCSGDPDPEASNLLSNQNNETNHTHDRDVGDDTGDVDPDADSEPEADADRDATADPDAGENGDADGDAEPDTDVEEENNDPVEVTGPCGPMLDLGELEWDEMILEVDFDFFDNDLTTKCDLGTDGDVAVYKFTTPIFHTSVINIDTGGQAAVEIRDGECSTDDDPTISCYEGSTEVALTPGSVHYLLLEQIDEAADSPMTVTIDFFEMPSCPFEEIGQASCVGDSQIEACQLLLISADTPRKFTAECPTGECANDRCIGDSCDAPIQVTSSYEWVGGNLGYFDTWDNNVEYELSKSEDRDSTCIDSTQVPPMSSTQGRELVFELPDLNEGAVVEIEVEVEMLEEFLVVVTETCDVGALCEEAWETTPEMTFVAPHDGTFYVIVDTRDDINEFFEISINIDPDD